MCALVGWGANVNKFVGSRCAPRHSLLLTRIEPFLQRDIHPAGQSAQGTLGEGRPLPCHLAQRWPCPASGLSDYCMPTEMSKWGYHGAFNDAVRQDGMTRSHTGAVIGAPTETARTLIQTFQRIVEHPAQ